MRLGFGDFAVDFDARELTRAGQEVHLEHKAFDFLELLIQGRPRVIAKAEILERLWPSTFVAESSLSRLAAELRAALGDDARSPASSEPCTGLRDGTAVDDGHPA